MEENKSGFNRSHLAPASIIITGSAGFIGSCTVQYLNEQGLENLILADKFIHNEKERNWKKKRYRLLVERELLFEWLDENNNLSVDLIIHLGARTDTAQFYYPILEELNLEYSQDIWNYCTANNVPLIYASSAATYGAGELGYDDNHEVVPALKPLNPYGVSKNEFDKWALQQINHPPYWAGLKFFNVYGPNEYHKARMASVIFHAYHQIQKEGVVKLFKSRKTEFKDGEQLRDFVYVKDVVKIIYWMLSTILNGEWHPKKNGIYNVGTGKARTFNDLIKATFVAINMDPHIVYVEMPRDILDTYQYFTEAIIDKLHKAGYIDEFTSLENGVTDYLHNYLSAGKIW